MDTMWQIELLGRLSIRQGEREIVHFRTRKTAALLAYLAYYPSRAHPREEIIEQFWPESESDAGHNSLRVALSVLRTQLEPEGVPHESVLLADRTTVQMSTTRYGTDVLAFEQALKQAAQAETEALRIDCLGNAIALYRGDLLPGYDTGWILPERHRLTDLYLGVLRRLARDLTHLRDFDRALDYARRAVIVDPLREESHRTLIRLYAAMGRPAAVKAQYRELERILQMEFASPPSTATRALVEQVVGGYETAVVAIHSPAASLSKPSAAFTRESSFVSAPKPSSGTDPVPTALPQTQCCSANCLPPTLPTQLTRFFGREEELAQLQALLMPANCEMEGETPTNPASHRHTASPCRLVTLTGTGGSGKTRLAMEVALRLRNVYRGAAFFVSLAERNGEEGLLTALREALNLPGGMPAEIRNQVEEALSERPVLLIFDNFEHLLTPRLEEKAQEHSSIEKRSPCLHSVRALLERLPLLTCLVTSRQRLNLDGEQEFLVMPLSTPMRTGTRETLLEFPCIQLFLDRAQAARRDFRLTERNGTAVAELCRRLEGIPLAIELAAAWAQSLSPAQMLAALSERSDLLVNRQADRVARHQTLQTTLDWSFRLLSPELQSLFGQLGVFRGGWTLEAATAICSVSPERSEEGRVASSEGRAGFSATAAMRMLEQITCLRERSLLFGEDHDDALSQVRFRMLEMVRSYAQERLQGIEQRTIAQRHADYFLNLAEHTHKYLYGPEQAEWLDRLDQEQENLWGALHWFEQERQIDPQLRMVNALVPFWFRRGPLAEGRKYLLRALAQEEAREAEGYARALHGAGCMARVQGDHAEAKALLEESLERFRAQNDRRGIADTLHVMGDLATGSGQAEHAGCTYQESLTIRQEIGDRPGMAQTLYSLASNAYEQNDFSTAKQRYEDCLALYRELEDTRGIAIALAGIGYLAYDRCDYGEAEACHQESLNLFRALGERRGIAFACNNLSSVYHARGDYAVARALNEESLQLRREVGDKHGIADTLCTLGIVAAAQQDFTAAHAHYEESRALYQKLGYTRGVSIVLENLAELENSQARLGT